MKKTVVASFGRMNPMTNGHEKLANKIASEARKRNADAKLYLSHSTNPKKDPLSYEQKVLFAKKAFGAMVQNSPARTIIEVAKELSGKYENLIVVVGSDRVSEFETLLKRYNGKDYSFENIDVISAGERDPDAEGVTGISGSKMRGFAEKGDFESFKKGVPSKLSDSDAKKLFDGVRKGMKINEEIQEAVLSFAQRRQRAARFRSMQKRIQRARALQMKRFADPSRLKRRAVKAAYSMFRKRFAAGKSYSDLSTGEKITVDKRLQKLIPVIKKIAVRLLPKIRQKEMQRKQSMITKQESVDESFSNFIFEKRIAQDPDIKTREGSQPKKYHVGLSKDEKEKRDAHFKKMGPKSDSDKSAYADAPGDEEAREKGMPQSKYTKKFKQMYGEEVDKKQMQRLDMLVRMGLADKPLLSVIKRAVAKLDSGETMSPQERKAAFDLLQTMLDMTLSTDQLFAMTRRQLQKEEVGINELAYRGNIGAMEMFQFFQKASSDQIAEMKKLVAEKKIAEALKLLTKVTGVKLKFDESTRLHEKGEYDDYEEIDGLEMAQIEVANLMQDAEALMVLLDQMEEEPEAWVLSKITKAVDYIESVTDYLEFENNFDYDDEDMEDDEEGSDDEGDFEDDFDDEIMDIYQTEEFADELKPLVEEIEGLRKKADKSGISYGILKQVYNRGMAAWKGGHRPGTTPQQWAFARVNSFITGGKTRTTADADLWAKVRTNEEFSNFMEAQELGTDASRIAYARMTPGQNPDLVTAKYSANTVLNVLNDINTQRQKKIFSEQKDVIQEAIEMHLEKKIPFAENVFRVGSQNYFEFFRQARELHESGKIELSSQDKHLIEETDIGKFGIYEDNPVPLDCPMYEEWEEIVEEEMTLWKYNPVTGLWKLERKVTPETKDKWLEIFKKDDPKAKFVVSKNKPGAKAHLKEEEEKDIELNKPKRGGPKKFYVYVKDPSTGNVKKVTWGDTTGLSVKLNDPEARKSFAARHRCEMQKDRTTAAYWACNLPRYAKQLGLSGGGNFFW